MASDKKKNSVVVSPLSLTTMLLHSAKHSTSTCHGILIGSFSGDTVRVTSAVPVCHEPPTKPLVDTSLSLVGGVVVGWYTAPERLDDEKAGAPALRIASGLATASSQGEPILIVLQNRAVAACLTEEGKAGVRVLKAFGKDFGQQWMEPLDVSLESETQALEAARKAHSNKIAINDLVDHWEADSPSAEWYPSASLAKYVEHSL